MNAELIQIIEIISIGNDYLNVENPENSKILLSNFQHYNSFDFKELRRKYIFSSKKEFIISKNPIDWFEYLKSQQCVKLRIFYLHENELDSKLAGFVGGGGNWFIETIFQNRSDLWISKWSYDKSLGDNPWMVSYLKVIKNLNIKNLQYNIKNTKLELQNILIKLINFSNKELNKYWVEVFDKAKDFLSDSMPEKNYSHEILVNWNNYQLENRQLLISAISSFVFGGMGSWNDMWFENEEIKENYNSLSNELYDIIIKSIICAINKDGFE